VSDEAVDFRPPPAPTPAPPERTPLACGALGRYDHQLLTRIRESLDARLDTVHRDRSSILMLDRPPIRWRSGLRRGLAWSEAMPRDARIRSWRDAARELGACGLVVEPGRRYLHSSVSGVAPLYHVDHGDATYFASRIDPLVTTLPLRFSVDWRSWSSILAIRHVVDAHTPFAEVSRLPQFAVLRRESRRGSAATAEWPWAAVDPVLSAEEGAPAVAEALREVVRSLRPPLNCLLSGGWDSRLLLCLLTEQLAGGISAYTVNMDVGNDLQERFAARVAEALGVEHTVVPAAEDSYWEDWVTRLRRSDFQHAAFPYMLPLTRKLAGRGVPVLDGLALDTRGRYTEPSMLTPDGGPRTSRMLFRRTRAKLGTRPEEALSAEIAAAIPTVAKRQFVRTSLPFRGHPSEALLTHTAARTMRAVSLMPYAVLGTDLRVLTPFTDDRVVTASLAIRPDGLYRGRLFTELFALVNPAVGRLPSNHDPAPPTPETRPRRKDSPAALRKLGDTLREGPLAPHLDGELRRHLDAGTLAEAVRLPKMARTAMTIAALHVWAERYASVLAEPDPADLLELAG
jgi:hypothetical protein